ncbi:hypothetical protein BH23ACT5_BH23ACT5_13560 [soil metagenome]
MDRDFDSLTFGRRLRHHRKQVGLTLTELGERVGRPAPFLSMLENGKRRPQPDQIGALADALGVDVGVLTDPEPPTRRAQLEIELERMQADARLEHLALPYVRPSPSLPDEVLGAMVPLYKVAIDGLDLPSSGRVGLRQANGAVQTWLTGNGGYLSDLEAVAQGVLKTAGHGGDSPLSGRNLLDIAYHLGFDIEAVEDMIGGVRSVTDTAHGRIYIAQRNELRTRQARKAILQTLAGRLLGHLPPTDVEEYLRQRVETAYLATAILIPESGAVARLQAAKADRDLSVEDLKEAFYVSYEMAAWRVANLATRHLDLATHLLVSDDSEVAIKGYANDGLPFSTDTEGGIEAQPVCRRWGAVAVLASPDRFDVHSQYTDTPAGTYFCVTHVEPDRPYVVTSGVPFEGAQWFRHRTTERRRQSTCPDPGCCRRPTPEQAARWNGKLEVSVRTQDRLLGLLASDLYPSPGDRRVYDLVERHSPPPPGPKAPSPAAP